MDHRRKPCILTCRWHVPGECLALAVVQSGKDAPARQAAAAASVTAEREDFIIIGRTRAGASRRPDDWAECLFGMMSPSGGDGYRVYSPHVQPPTLEDIRVVSVSARPRTAAPPA